MESPYWDTSAARIDFDAASSAVRVVWKGYVHGERRREVLAALLRYVAQTQSRGLLVDAREVFVLPMEDELWGREQWTPRAVEHGVRSIAIVQPPSRFSEEFYRSVFKSAPPGAFSSRQFPDFESARAWLRERETES